MVIAAMKLKDAYSLKGKLWPTLMYSDNQKKKKNARAAYKDRVYLEP